MLHELRRHESRHLAPAIRLDPARENGSAGGFEQIFKTSCLPFSQLHGSRPRACRENVMVLVSSELV